jgi:hypothetical protein
VRISIGLQNGESYAGYVDVADTSVAPGERDVILREPALFEPSRGNYRFLEHDSLFLLGSTIASVAVLYEPTIDKRVTEVGDVLLDKEVIDGHGKERLRVREVGEGHVGARQLLQANHL